MESKMEAIKMGTMVEVTKIAETSEGGYAKVGEKFVGPMIYMSVDGPLWIGGDNGLRTSKVESIEPIEPGMVSVKTMNSTYKVQEIR